MLQDILTASFLVLLGTSWTLLVAKSNENRCVFACFRLPASASGWRALGFIHPETMEPLNPCSRMSAASFLMLLGASWTLLVAKSKENRCVFVCFRPPASAGGWGALGA